MCLLGLWFSLDICLGVEFLDHMVALFLVFQGTSMLFSIVAISIYISTNSGGEFIFIHILFSINCLWTF